MSKIFEFMKAYSGMILCTAALLAVAAATDLILPGYVADIVNDGVLPGNSALIWRVGGTMILITVIGVSASLAAGYFISKTSASVSNDLRKAVFKKVIRFSNAEVDKFTTSSLITRTTHDIGQVQVGMMAALRQFIYSPVIVVGGIVRALERSVNMTWAIIVISICILGVFTLIIAVAFPKFKIVQNLVDRLNLVSRENLTGILVVRAFSTQKFEKKRFDKANKDLANTNAFIFQTFAFMFPMVMLVANISVVVIVWTGALEASALRVDIGDIFAFMQYVGLVIAGFIMVATTLFIFMPQAVVSAGRIREVLETTSSIRYKKKPKAFSQDFRGIVEFRNVSFRYPGGKAKESDENVLQDISFTASPSQTTAIIGSTGAGKTTILQLLLRFYDVTGGAIYIDGVDVRDIRKKDLHEKIGYVSQKAMLFSGDIRSNLLYADRNAGESRILDAADTAQATAFIAEKPEGYESNVAQGGSNLSGGQRQRLSIARALVKNVPIYLFDDSFSALDLKTDALLRTALKRKTGDSTMLVVAQRISSIMDAQQILVLDCGKIVGCGTHGELMKTCEVYREIAASQLNEEENA